MDFSISSLLLYFILFVFVNCCSFVSYFLRHFYAWFHGLFLTMSMWGGNSRCWLLNFRLVYLLWLGFWLLNTLSKLCLWCLDYYTCVCVCVCPRVCFSMCMCCFFNKHCCCHIPSFGTLDAEILCSCCCACDVGHVYCLVQLIPIVVQYLHAGLKRSRVSFYGWSELNWAYN